MNDPHDATLSARDDAETLAADIDPRFDPAASGGESGDSGVPAQVRSAQEQLDELATATQAWVRDKPFQALAVAAGLGFLLGRVGR